MPDEELMELAGTQAVTGLVANRQVPVTVGRLLPGCFPDPPDQPYFSRRLRRLTPQITAAQLGVAELVTAGSLRLVGVEPVVLDRRRLGERPPAEIAKACIRLVMASLFATLKRQMRLEDQLAETLAGVAQRVVERLLALTLGMLINSLLDRRPRALAAYDGR